KSNNGGSYMYGINGYWSNDRVNWSAPVIMRPNDPDVMYFGTYRVWKSTNGGESWTAVSGDLTDGDDGSTFHTITTLACSPVNGNYILAGTDDARVHISINGGGTWTDISDGLPDRWITRVAFDPFDGNTIYATCSGFRWDATLPHVFKSTDLGQTWESISGNLPELPVNAFIADPSMHERYFVGTDAGVFWTKDGGLQWESLNGTLGNVPVTSMKIHDSENFLLIGTYGLGAYKLDLAQLTVGTKNINLVSGLSISSIYPQPYDPSVGLLNISIQSDKSSPSSISITDLNGKVVYYNDDISLQQGSTLLRFNKNLKPGIYLISVKSQGRQVTEKILAI
ncbi:MAG: T9SS type A sorting domain-containing protein, partial [Chloroflexota bacterium]